MICSLQFPRLMVLLLSCEVRRRKLLRIVNPTCEKGRLVLFDYSAITDVSSLKNVNL
jgi:hypothetical protein